MDKKIKGFIVVLDNGENEKYKEGVFLTTEKCNEKKVRVISANKVSPEYLDAYISGLKSILEVMESERDKLKFMAKDVSKVLKEFRKFLDERIKESENF